ncbi:response regulator transcription factor [Chryseobacterium takakiae]|jgi:DNA-binding NarL/FixJ family response regulator|uniref:Two component transcriptional regulator, LuxR family n=1 Tax=Chryseobacterium takakiae TaxID=1302685 RepID=A0A1M4WK76_9FLAO|nr:response regulator transcription factor [Chryseobacterium takakiae]SHE81550.1 two component transcriptional regulator, LuxR family [Chryseobacterium takakiae]
METNTKSVLIIDDHSIVRQGVFLLIRKYFPNTNIFEASTLNDGKTIIKKENINFIILDINFPEGNSLNFVENLSIEYGDSIKILIFSALEETIYAFNFIKAGAHGFLSKLSEQEEIVRAFSKFFETGKYLSDELKERLLDNMIRKSNASPIEMLSIRELEIARLLVAGLSNNEIASKLYIHKSTVSTYKTRIFEKLGINNIPALLNLFNLN